MSLTSSTCSALLLRSPGTLAQNRRHIIADATSCPPSCQRSLLGDWLSPRHHPVIALCGRSGISRHESPQVLLDLCVASLARRILVTALTPVNPARELFFANSSCGLLLGFGCRCGVEKRGLEPLTSCLQSSALPVELLPRPQRAWPSPPVRCVCAYLDSNQGPRFISDCALAN